MSLIKEKLEQTMQELRQSLDRKLAKKIDISQLERISKRLIQFFDECEQCRNYTSILLQHIENTHQFQHVLNKQEWKNFEKDRDAIIAHLQSEHKLLTDGYYLTIGLSLGLALGTALGVSSDNLALGVSLGPMVGLAIGIVIDSHYKKKGRVI